MKLMDFGAFDDVTDPSDFSTENLQKLDSSLRCTICKDFYDAPVMLHCGHTFCSLVTLIVTFRCIRAIDWLFSALDLCFQTNQNAPYVGWQRKRHILFAIRCLTTLCTSGQMLGRSYCSLNHSPAPTYLVLPSLNRALVLKFSKDSLHPPATPSNLNNKRKRSLPPPDPNQEAGPSKLPYGYGEHQDQDNETDRPRKSRRLSIEEEIVISSDPEEQELPNHAISGLTLLQRAQIIPTLCTENSRVTCPLCSRQVPYNSINPHMDSNCKKYILGDDLPAIAKPNSKAAWGSIFKGQGKKAATFSRSVARLSRLFYLS